jgi:hypothetical protein
MGKSLTDDGDLVLSGLELPEGNIDGDTTLTLSLEFVKNPGVLEGTLSELSSLLLELLDGTLVNTTTLVDHVTSGGGLAGIDMADNDDVDVVTLFLTVLKSVSVLKRSDSIVTYPMMTVGTFCSSL